MANSFNVLDTSASGASGETAIVGENPTPYGSAILGLTTTDAFSTGDLNQGDAGDMGLLAEFAVELWIRWRGGLPGVDNSFFYGPTENTGATRQWLLTIKAAGNITGDVVDDSASVRNVAGGTLLQLNTFYHIVLTAKGGNLSLYINGGLDANNAAWGSHFVRAIGSTAGSEDMRLIGPTVGGINVDFDEVAVYRTGLSATRVLEHYSAGVNRGFRTQLPGARVTAVLDAVSSYAPRSIQAGSRNVIPRYMSGQAPLEECRRALEAEDVDAVFFVAADGTLRFLAAGHRNASPYNTIQATFGDAESELAYLDLDTDYSDAELINEWNVTRSSFGPTPATTQTASDQASIARYFKRSRSLSDVPTTSDTNCANIATALLAKTKDPLYRITSINFDTTDPSVSDAVLQRELMDKVRIYRTPPGGGARIQQDVYIQKIDISGGNDGKPWSIRWAVSPL